MRVVDQLPHPTFRIQLFHFGTNYLVEIEAGPMKQTYRYPNDRFPSPAAVWATVTPEFLESVHKSFNGMYQDWIATWPPKD
jgi:hypothetical protein